MNKIVNALVAAALLIIVTSISASAQIGGQAGLVLPAGDWFYPSNPGLAVQAYYKVDLGDGMKIGGSVGFYTFKEVEKNRILAGDHVQFPVLATFDYALNDQIYVGADAGYTIFNSPNWLGNGFAPASGASLIPKVGLKFGDLSVEGRVNVIPDRYFALLLGFAFGG